MSERALVLFPSDTSAESTHVTIHKSQNGAHQLNLYPVLEHLTDDDLDKVVTSLQSPEDRLTNRIREVRESFGEDPSENDDPLVDPNPLIPNAEYSSVGNVIDFVRFEAVFDLNQHYSHHQKKSVNVYLPIFVDIGLIFFFARYIILEVYPKSELPSNHREAITGIAEGQISPKHRLERDDYLTLENPEAKEHFIDGHLGILQNLYALTNETGDEVTAIVMTEDDYIVGKVDTTDDVPLPDPQGTGILIQLPVGELPYEKVTTLYYDWKNLAARMRVNHAQKAAVELLTELDEDDPALGDADPYIQAFVEDIADEFESAISPLSPQSYLDMMDHSL